jgi:hypothetical protein
LISNLLPGIWLQSLPGWMPRFSSCLVPLQVFSLFLVLSLLCITNSGSSSLAGWGT